MAKKPIRICSSEGCKEKYYAKGFCIHHYRQTTEYKARTKEERSRPEYKTREKERRTTPEYKAQQKARKKERESIPGYKEKINAKQRKYNSKPEVKSKRKKFYSDPEYLKRLRNLRDVERLQVLQYYSKRLSKSNNPCCNCCGENFHIDFLAVDHIAGMKKMDFEPELVKLGYSSNLGTNNLMHWIIVNNFPKGFQILCHKCNFAKGIEKNKNKCPHQK